VVGAGGAPGDSFHQRLDFSNYGSRVDAFAYGEEVVTTGWHGDLFKSLQYPGTYDYTATFQGTSSAAAIVAGVVADLVGIGRAEGIEIDPLDLREAIRLTGSPQLGDTTQHIGNQPDLRQLVSILNLD